jgi:hypothetical protein
MKKVLRLWTSDGHHGGDTAAPDPGPGPVIGVAVGPSCCSQLGQWVRHSKGPPTSQIVEGVQLC